MPTLQFKWDVVDVLDIYDFSELYISSSTSFDVNDADLFYNNQSHNSLLINPSESLQYLATNDLFLDRTVKLEEKETYNIGLGGSFSRFNFNVTYFNTTRKNAVFPVLENNAFQLQNVADILNKGIEAEVGANLYLDYQFYCKPTLTFSANRTNVLKLADNANSIAIAGFNTTSKRLIVGESAGVIVGSAYARDDNNNVIIGNDGFPLVANEDKIIGDPTPDFTISLSNTLTFRDLSLSFIIDAQKGGDIWNGTQNVLNYHGVSKQSANERETTNYVFNGVNEQGAINTIPVDFYNTTTDFNENKFVRYGFEGVAEDAIVDGSYINIRSIDLIYKPIRSASDKVIKDLSDRKSVV